MKKPDSYLDKNVIIYARVTQFDSATGPCTFRANVSHAQVGKYDYEHNTIFNAGDGLTNCDILDDVVAEDIVKVTATVTSSLTYDTQVGGSTTVPEMQVVKITRLSRTAIHRSTAAAVHRLPRFLLWCVFRNTPVTRRETDRYARARFVTHSKPAVEAGETSLAKNYVSRRTPSNPVKSQNYSPIHQIP